VPPYREIEMTDAYQKRDKELVRLVEQTDIPMQKIADDAGISYERLRQIVRENGGKPRTRKRRSVSTSHGAQRPVSPLLAQVGSDINYQRNRMGLTASQFARQVPVSTVKLRAIELGIAGDVTLRQLEKIAAIIDIDLTELVRLRSEKKD
jgi:ribosome-binding protein aMBF1 (putative translation factor)